MSCERWQERLQAYTDDSCTPEAAAEVEVHLRECPSCALEALALERMKRSTRTHGIRYTPSAGFQERMAEMVRRATASTADLEPAPEEEMAPPTARSGGKRRMSENWSWRNPQWTFALAGVALVVVLVAVMAGLWTQHEGRRQAWTELVDMHVATLASVNPVDVVSTDRHTVKPWFAGKLPFTFSLPELQNSNYRLVGGKLVYLDGAPAAQLVYAVAKHEISEFVFEERSTGKFGKNFSGDEATTKHDKGFTVERWSNSGLSYVIISDANAADVHALGEMVRTAARP